MSTSERLPLHMQSGEKHVRRSRRAQKANRFWQPNSLVIRRTKLNNGLRGKRVSPCSCVCVCVSVWWDGEGHVGWPFSVAPLPWPISFNQAARQALPFLPRPLLSATPTRVLHYGALPGQCLETSPEEATGRERDKEGPDFTKEKNPIFIKILPLSCFLEVITGLPKLDWGK